MTITTTTATRSDAEVRTAIKTIFGAKNARVTRNGEAHVRGAGTGRGWCLIGFTGGQSDLDDKIWKEDGSLRTSLR